MGVRVTMIKSTRGMLETALGLKLQDITIDSAQMSHRYWQNDCLELVLTGESLPVKFETAKVGDKIKDAEIILHTKVINTEFTVAKVQNG